MLTVIDHGANAYPQVTGKCMWCGEYVTNGAREAGAPPGTIDWMVDGDYGCDGHSLTNGEGCWSHQTREDVARILLAADKVGII